MTERSTDLGRLRVGSARMPDHAHMRQVCVPSKLIARPSSADHIGGSVRLALGEG